VISLGADPCTEVCTFSSCVAGPLLSEVGICPDPCQANLRVSLSASTVSHGCGVRRPELGHPWPLPGRGVRSRLSLDSDQSVLTGRRSTPARRARDGPTCRALRLPSTGWGCYSPIARPLPFSHWRNREGRSEGGCMPRRRSLVSVIRDMVREQVQEAVQGLLGAVGGAKKKAKNGRRRRRGRRGPGRPPGSKTQKRRGPGRPRKT